MIGALTFTRLPINSVSGASSSFFKSVYKSVSKAAVLNYDLLLTILLCTEGGHIQGSSAWKVIVLENFQEYEIHSKSLEK